MFRAVTKAVYEDRKPGLGVILTLSPTKTLAFRAGGIVHANASEAKKLEKLKVLGPEVKEAVVVDPIVFGNRIKTEKTIEAEDGTKKTIVELSDQVIPKGTRLALAELGADAVDVLHALSVAPPEEPAKKPSKKDAAEG